MSAAPVSPERQALLETAAGDQPLTETDGLLDESGSEDSESADGESESADGESRSQSHTIQG